MDSDNLNKPMEAGFYKKEENGSWSHSTRKVYHKDYCLCISKKDEYDYPVHGWEYYDLAPKEYVAWHKELMKEPKPDEEPTE